MILDRILYPWLWWIDDQKPRKDESERTQINVIGIAESANVDIVVVANSCACDRMGTVNQHSTAL